MCITTVTVNVMHVCFKLLVYYNYLHMRTYVPPL